MIQHHGNAILPWPAGGGRHLGAAQAELVQSRRLPDGVLEVRTPGQAEPDIYILEIASYPDARVPSQVVCDVALSFLTAAWSRRSSSCSSTRRGTWRRPTRSSCKAVGG